MKAVIKDNTKILLSKLNSQELAVLENFITKSTNYKAEISKLDNIDGEIDGINFKITDELKNQISYESPYNIVLLPRTVANIDLKVESDVTVEVINNYEDYLDTSIENNIISVSLKEVPELKDKCINYNLGIKLSKEDYNDINLNIIVCGIYSLSGATKLSDLENDMGFIDNTVDDLVNYYTKTETDNLLDTKQDTLTAGTNITIENGTISATDTIYDDTKLRNDISNIESGISNIESNISNIESDINNLESGKIDKVQGKGLSTEDFTTEEKTKLASLENYDDTQIRDEITTLNSTKADKSEIPTDVSELNNDANYATTSYVDDNFLKKTNNISYTPTTEYNPATKKYVDDSIPDVSNFITNSVDDLVNYYKKSETYTQTEVNTLIGNIQHFHYEIVQSLPQSGEINIIYLVPKSTSQTNNYYDEYVYANNAWEKIGDTEVDLSNYVTTNDLNSALQDYTTTTDLTTLLDDKQDTLVSGTNIKTINNTSILGSGNVNIESGDTTYLGKISEHNSSATALNLNGLKKGIYIIYADATNLYLEITNSTNSIVVQNSTITGVSENSYIWNKIVYIQINEDIPNNGLPQETNIGKILYIRNAIYSEQNISMKYFDMSMAVKSSSLYINTASVSSATYMDLYGAQTVNGIKTFNKLPESSVVPTINSQLTNKKYVDDKSIQYSTMPTASSSNVGQIIQYTGTTTNDYTNGYFYVCVEDNNVYSWENINVQENSGNAKYVLEMSYLGATIIDYNTDANKQVFQQILDNKNTVTANDIIIKLTNNAYPTGIFTNIFDLRISSNAIIIRIEQIINSSTLGNFQEVAYNQIAMNYSNNTVSGNVNLYTYSYAHIPYNKMSNIEQTYNKVTSISSSSTDNQYPTAKCVYDLVGDISTTLDTINGEVI